MYNPDGSSLHQQQQQQQLQLQVQPQQNNAGRSLDKYERFEAWLRENGAQFDLVS